MPWKHFEFDLVNFITSSSYSLFNFKFSNKSFDLELKVETNFFRKKISRIFKVKFEIVSFANLFLG